MSGTDKPKRGENHRSTIKTIADLKPDPKNARKHSERNIGMLERSLEQYGGGTLDSDRRERRDHRWSWRA